MHFPETGSMRFVSKAEPSALSFEYRVLRSSSYLETLCNGTSNTYDPPSPKACGGVSRLG